MSIAHWSKTLLIPEEWLCGCAHCTQQKTGLVHSRSKCWMRLVPMALPFSTDASRAQTMHSRSLQLSNGSDGHILMMPCLKDSKRHEPLLTTTRHIINLGDYRLDTQPTPPHMDKGLNNTHLMMKHPHSWWTQTSGVTTRWKHVMCIVHSNHSVALNEEHRLSRV